MNSPILPSKVMDISLGHVDEQRNILLTLELTLLGSLNAAEAVAMINDVHFDQNGSTGNYRLLSPCASDSNADYVHTCDKFGEEKIESIYNFAVKSEPKETKVKILLAVDDYETVEEEMIALALEFDEFVYNGSCVAWKQLPMLGTWESIPVMVAA